MESEFWDRCCCLLGDSRSRVLQEDRFAVAVATDFHLIVGMHSALPILGDFLDYDGRRTGFMANPSALLAGLSMRLACVTGAVSASLYEFTVCSHTFIQLLVLCTLTF